MGRSLLEGAGNISVQKSGVGLGRNEERQKQGKREKGGVGRKGERRGGERGGGRKERQGGERQGRVSSRCLLSVTKRN